MSPYTDISALKGGLDLAHAGGQFIIIFSTVNARMNAAMTVWTEGDHEAWIVWAAVAEPTKMVGLQIRQSVWAQEWCSLSTALAVAKRASTHVDCNISAALNDRPLPALTATGLRICRGHRAGAKLREIYICSRISTIQIDGYVFDVAQLEDKCLAHIVVTVGGWLEVMSLVDHLAKKAEGATLSAKEKQNVTVLGVLQHSAIPPIKAHISDLALTEVLEYAIITLSIVIAVLLPCLSGYDRNQPCSGCDDTSLALPAKSAVNIAHAIVKDASLKAERHLIPPVFRCPVDDLPISSSFDADSNANMPAPLCGHRRASLVAITWQLFREAA